MPFAWHIGAVIFEVEYGFRGWRGAPGCWDGRGVYVRRMKLARVPYDTTEEVDAIFARLAGGVGYDLLSRGSELNCINGASLLHQLLGGNGVLPRWLYAPEATGKVFLAWKQQQQTRHPSNRPSRRHHGPHLAWLSFEASGGFA